MMEILDPKFLGAMGVGGIICLGVAIFFLKHFTRNLLTKIESAVTRTELQLATLQLEKELRGEIEKTRHSLRNEMHSELLIIGEKMEHQTELLQVLKNGLVRIETIVRPGVPQIA